MEGRAMEGKATGQRATEQQAEFVRHEGWQVLSQIGLTLRVQVPVLKFRVNDLLKLEAGHVVRTACVAAEDVPLRIGKVQVGWTEFEAVGEQRAVRVTRLA